MSSITVTQPSSANSNQFTITIAGTFDTNLKREFLELIDSIPENTGKIVVDLDRTRYLGISAMSTLLPLRRRTRAWEANVILKNCNPTIRASLIHAGFNENFEIC